MSQLFLLAACTTTAEPKDEPGPVDGFTPRQDTAEPDSTSEPDAEL
jgi:hypothetical protein